MYIATAIRFVIWESFGTFSVTPSAEDKLYYNENPLLCVTHSTTVKLHRMHTSRRKTHSLRFTHKNIINWHCIYSLLFLVLLTCTTNWIIGELYYHNHLAYRITHLPLFVITISVPNLWNFSHKSLPSSVTFGSSTTPSSSGCIWRIGLIAGCNWWATEAITTSSAV